MAYIALKFSYTAMYALNAVKYVVVKYSKRLTNPGVLPVLVAVCAIKKWIISM